MEKRSAEEMLSEDEDRDDREESEVWVSSAKKRCCDENRHTSSESSWSTQIQLACENLIWSGNFERLERFIWALPDVSEVRDKEVVSIAKAFIAYKNEKYSELYDILRSRQYSKKYHSLLQVSYLSL